MLPVLLNLAMNQIWLVGDPADAQESAIVWACNARWWHAGGINALNRSSGVRVYLIKAHVGIAIMQVRPDKPATAVRYDGIRYLIIR